MKILKNIKQEIVDENGRQIALVLATNCTKKFAQKLAKFAAEQANLEERRLKRKKLLEKLGYEK